MTRRLLFSLFLLVVGPVGTASAHSPIKGIGTFYNGLLHPVMVPTHLLLLVALGLLVGQGAPRASRFALPTLAAAIMLSLVLTFAAPQTLPPWTIHAVALAAGLTVALSWSQSPALSVVLAAIAGVLIALDSPPDGSPRQEIWLALAGTGLGAMLFVTCLGGLAAWLDRPWQKIAVRAAGSWVAASAILVLALRLITPAIAPT